MSDDAEILRELQAGIAKRRGYADGRSWPLDRAREERGIVGDFVAASVGEPGAPFSSLRSRPPGEDPPDCEVVDSQGNQIGIEVTELVDSAAIRDRQRNEQSASAEWSASRLIAALEGRIAAKDVSDKVRGGPYHEYFVVIHTAEPHLYFEDAREWLTDHLFATPELLSRAYLLFDYEPQVGLSVHSPVVLGGSATLIEGPSTSTPDERRTTHGWSG